MCTIESLAIASGMWNSALLPLPPSIFKFSLQVNLNQPMNEMLAELSKHPIKTRVSLTGTLIVARDIAHAKLKERLDRGEGLPQYVKDHPIYYAGPAKTPEVRVWCMQRLNTSFIGC